MVIPNDLPDGDDPDGSDFKTPAPDSIPLITQEMLDAALAETPRAAVDLKEAGALRADLVALITLDGTSTRVRSGVRSKLDLVFGALVAGTQLSDNDLLRNARQLYQVLRDGSIPASVSGPLRERLERLVPIAKID